MADGRNPWQHETEIARAQPGGAGRRRSASPPWDARGVGNNPATKGQVLQYVPPPKSGQTLGELFPGAFGKGGGRGGGGGYDPYAQQRADEERRRAAMREAIQAQYGQAIGSLQGLNHETMGALGGWHQQAMGQINPIYDKNQALTGQYSQQLAGLAQNASRGVLDQGDLVSRDLQAQGAGLGNLQGQISGDVRDILGARSGADQYNTRLAEVMGLSRADNSAMLNAILQAAQSQRENAYTSQYNQLTAEQAMKLAELA